RGAGGAPARRARGRLGARPGRAHRGGLHGGALGRSARARPRHRRPGYGPRRRSPPRAHDDPAAHADRRGGPAVVRPAPGAPRSGPKNLPDVLELSMGMSLDYQVAIEEGATMVRIGTALVGARTA